MLDRANPPRAVALGRRNEEREQGREEDDRVDERAEERARHGDGHGPEHLALDALEREQRHVDEHDDRDRESPPGGPPRTRLRRRRRRGPLFTSVLPASAAITASRMTIGPSTRKPKSMAPRLMRSPVTPKTCMPISAIAIEAGIPSTTDQRAADASQEEREHDADDQRALDQILE